MLEQGLHTIVMLDSGVRAVVGSRIYPVILPEDPTYPCASYQVISTVPEYTVDSAGIPAMEKRRVQFDTWSGGTNNPSYAAAKAAQAAIRAVLESFTGMLPGGIWVLGIFVSSATDLYEQDARCFRTKTDFMVHFNPAT